MFDLKNILKLMSIGIIVSVLSACSDDDDDSDDPGYYRFVNLSAQGTVIAVEVEEEHLADLNFAQSTNLLSVNKDTYELEFDQILPNSENNNFIEDDEVKVSRNTIHSYILYGDADNPESIEIETDVKQLYDEDFADDYDYGLVQFVNLADTTDSYDVYILDAGDDLLNAEPETTLAYLDQSNDIEQENGDYKFIITEPGTDNIVIASDNISINTGQAYLYALVSYKVSTDQQERMALVELDNDSARVLNNDAQPAYIRFNHAVSGNNLINVLIEDAGEAKPIVSDLYFGEISEQIALDIDDLQSGDSRDFYLVDSVTEEVLDSFTLDIDPDSQLNVIAAGMNQTSIRVNEVEEDLRITNTHVKIIYSHAIDDERDDSIEFLIVEDGASPDSYNPQVTLSYLTEEEYEIEQGDYQIYVYNENTGELLIQENLYGLEKGEVVNLTATESEEGGAPYQLHEVKTN